MRQNIGNEQLLIFSLEFVHWHNSSSCSSSGHLSECETMRNVRSMRNERFLMIINDQRPWVSMRKFFLMDFSFLFFPLLLSLYRCSSLRFSFLLDTSSRCFVCAIWSHIHYWHRQRRATEKEQQQKNEAKRKEKTIRCINRTYMSFFFSWSFFFFAFSCAQSFASAYSCCFFFSLLFLPFSCHPQLLRDTHLSNALHGLCLCVEEKCLSFSFILCACLSSILFHCVDHCRHWIKIFDQNDQFFKVIETMKTTEMVSW